MKIKIKKLASDAIIPIQATISSAGLDLSACISENIELQAGAINVIPTGIAIALPEGFEAQIRPRSGLAAKHGITVLNSPGTIDADYRGELKVILINHGSVPFIIENGMRIAQMVVAEHKTLDFIEESFEDKETHRGVKGFGSTGVNNM